MMAMASTAAARAGGLSRVQRKARRHSRLVRVFRILLPLLGLGILVGMGVLIAIFNYLSNLGIDNISLSSDGLVMHQPELSGHDGDRSYKVSAVRAVQRLSDPRIIDLETIHAQIVLSKDQNAQITALKGTYDNGAETLSMYDGLQIEWSEGYTVDMSDVMIDLKSGALKTSDPITIRSDKGQIRAGKLDYDQDNGVVRFTDGIQMVLNPSAQEKVQK